MTALNEIIEGYGIEYIYPSHGKTWEAVAEYVNLGETYATTLLRKIETGTIILTSWGDFVEGNRL